MITQMMRLDITGSIILINLQRYVQLEILAGQSEVQQNLLLEDKLTQEGTGETAQQTLMIEKTSFNKICKCRPHPCLPKLQQGFS
jgi:hypothetical protein